jgi:hypothetical protein
MSILLCLSFCDEEYMPLDSPIRDLVRQLSRAGLRPDERLVQRILEQGVVARGALLELALEVQALWDADPATSLGPLHALRLLGEMPDLELIAPLFDQIPLPMIDEEEDVAAVLYALELNQIVARIGAPAVAALWAYIDAETTRPASRTVALGALAAVATYAPEVRDEVLAEVRRRLAETKDQAIGTGLVIVLAELGDTASYKAVIAAYQAGLVNQKQVPAATARQLLLGGGRESLEQVHYSLHERYERLGPFAEPPEGRA